MDSTKAPVKASNDFLYKSAYNNFHSNNLNAAMHTLNNIVSTDSRYYRAYFLRSLINEIRSNYDLAISDLKMAISISAAVPDLHYNLGNIYFKTSQYELALDEFSIAINCKKYFPSAVLNRANTYMKLSRYEEALLDYKTYITLCNKLHIDSQKEAISKLIAQLESETNK